MVSELFDAKRRHVFCHSAAAAATTAGAASLTVTLLAASLPDGLLHCAVPRCAVLCYHAGVVTFDDMQIMLRQLAGSTLSDEEINTLVRRALSEAQAPQGLTLRDFKETLSAQELAGMVVEVPTEL